MVGQPYSNRLLPPNMSIWAAQFGLGRLFVDIRIREEEIGKGGGLEWMWEELGKRVREE